MRFAFITIAFAVTALGNIGASQPLEISLLELPVIKYEVGFADLWIGKNVDRKKVLLGGEEIEDYLFAHAPSHILYEIPPGVTAFEAWGVKTQGDDNVFGSWIYIVKIDGKEVFRSNPLVDYYTYEVPIKIRFPAGSKEIELIIDDLSNRFADHSIWALPKFIKYK
jgi:hypothetical protein